MKSILLQAFQYDILNRILKFLYDKQRAVNLSFIRNLFEEDKIDFNILDGLIDYLETEGYLKKNFTGNSRLLFITPQGTSFQLNGGYMQLKYKPSELTINEKKHKILEILISEKTPILKFIPIEIIIEKCRGFILPEEIGYLCQELNNDGNIDIFNQMGKIHSIRINPSSEGAYINKIYTTETLDEKNNKELNTDIFIVHGHDELLKQKVARTLTGLKLNPIILNEKPSEGKTIIEKFEASSKVSVAIILLTADDHGKIKSSTDYVLRARQNVVLEMGYFIGKLGRKFVVPIFEEGVELPSDLHGLGWIKYDKEDAWKIKLVKELRAIGLNISADDLI